VRDERKTTRELQRVETRERLFQAAVQVFRRDGVAASRIEDITSLAGTSRGLFYFHFPTREDVLVELLRRSEGDLADEIASLPPETPLREVLRTVAVALTRRWEPEPALFAELGAVAFRGVGVDGMTSIEHLHPALAALTPRFEAAAERGELGDLVPPPLAASFFLVNLFAAALMWAGAPQLPLGMLLENLVDFTLRGAAARREWGA